ncbi:hypothetical protein B0H19DRAFT_1017495 [Mycena capillaripes]|nr:hypothetical protein B0H19DRAFT_1017495 [Mycena capillaripes]
MDPIFEALQREFCPPLDSSLLAALFAEIDLDAPSSQIDALRSTLIELAVHADESQPAADDFSCSDETSSSFPDFCTTTTTTSASDLSGGSLRSAPLNSPLGFLQAVLPHVPTARLVSALQDTTDDEEIDMWEIICAILSEETEKEMRERDLDEDEMKEMAATEAAPWETVETKRVVRKTKKKPPTKGSKITLSDVRQQQHARAAPGPSSRARLDDPWAQLASLATHVAQCLPPYPASYFLSFFHDPSRARTPYAALCAALSAICTASPSDADADAHTPTLFNLLDMLLPAYAHLDPDARARLVSDVELALRAAQGRGEDAFELVRLLRDLDADADDGHFEMGVYHTPPVSPALSSPKSYSYMSPPLPTGPAATPPPPKLKPPLSASAAGKANNPFQWQAVPTRRRAAPREAYPHAMHIPAYAVNVNGVRTARKGSVGGGGGGGGEGSSISAYRRRAAMRKRDELLHEAARMWQRGNKKTRGGEVAAYFAERAREFQEVARREALEAARMLVEDKRSTARDRDTVDLHGVTAAEAVVIVNDILREQTWSSDKPLKIITGRGTHSAGQVSVLKPAVRKALEEDGWVVGAWDAGLTVRGRRGGRGVS